MTIFVAFSDIPTHSAARSILLTPIDFGLSATALCAVRSFLTRLSDSPTWIKPTNSKSYAWPASVGPAATNTVPVSIWTVTAKSLARRGLSALSAITEFLLRLIEPRRRSFVERTSPSRRST
jgi:hypothetical protein